MALSRYETFVARLNIGEREWRGGVAAPYISAYQLAYDTYKDTLSQQRDADKEAGELFVTAACIATGSVLLATVGSATINMIAKRTVARIANASLLRNFSQLFRVARKNEAVTFAVGKFIDGARDDIKKKAEKIAADAVATLSTTIAPHRWCN